MTDPGFDVTLWHDVRGRVLTHAAGQRPLDALLAACDARGWLNARSTPRTDSTHVLAAIRALHRMACVFEAMHDALNQLGAAAPAGVQPHVSLDWYARDGLRADQTRLPKDASKRAALARQVGADGDQLLAWVQTADPSRGFRALPALEVLRQIWRQHYDRYAVPGLAMLRWRMGDEQPPRGTAHRLPR